MLNAEVWETLLVELLKITRELQPDLIVGIEARGFLVGSALATVAKLGFVPVRKKGKLPGQVVSRGYKLEYGEDVLELQKDVLGNGTKVLIIDDLLATGGTANTCHRLVAGEGAEVIGFLFIVELTSLSGRSKLPSDIPIRAMVTY